MAAHMNMNDDQLQPRTEREIIMKKMQSNHLNIPFEKVCLLFSLFT